MHEQTMRYIRLYVPFKTRYTNRRALCYCKWDHFTMFICLFFWFVTYTIIQSITQQWNLCSAFNLEQWAADAAAPGEQFGGSVPCTRVSPQSWTIPAGAEIQTHNLRLQVRLYPLGHDCPNHLIGWFAGILSSFDQKKVQQHLFETEFCFVATLSI